MATDANNPNQAGVSGNEPQDDFISIADIVRMILKHRLKIAVFVILVTIVSAAVFLLSPRQYKAEGFLQIIPPIAKDGQFDQASLETIAISHLQAIQSAFITREVASAISTGAVKVLSSELEKNVKIIRPPKSNLIILTAGSPSPGQAVAVIRTWIQKYLVSIQKNNINTGLCQIRLKLKNTQADLIDIQARVEQLKARVAQTSPLVDLARGIDNSQLWRELAANATAEKLNDLSHIRVNGQEQSSEYLALRAMLNGVDQGLASAVANRNFLKDAESILEYKLRQMDNLHPTNQLPHFSSNAVLYVETMLNVTDVTEIGEPSVKSSSRGALRKTAIAFLVSLVAASFCACLCEWYKTLKI